MNKKLVYWGLGVGVLIAWLVVGYVVTVQDLSKEEIIIWVGGAALVTELAFWVVAVMIGVSVFQARKEIWARLKARFKSTD